MLRRVAVHELARRRHQLRSIRGPEFDDLAQQAADDALVNVLDRLDERKLGALDQRVQDLHTSVMTVQDSLDDLTRRAGERIAEQRAEDHEHATAPARAILADPSPATVHAALDQGFKLGALGNEIFLPVRDQNVTLHFSRRWGMGHWSLGTYAIHDDPAVETISYTWVDDQPVDEFLVRFDQKLRERFGTKAPTFEAGAVIKGLAGIIDAAMLRRAAGGSSLDSRLLAVATEHWLVTTAGLEHIADASLRVPREHISEVDADGIPPALVADLRDSNELRAAWMVARTCFAAGT